MKPKNKRPAAIILGTRPEIIKMSPVIRHFQHAKRPFILIHTGQHYSYEMDRLFFKDLRLPEPDYQFRRPASYGANRHAQLVEWMERSIANVLKKVNPHAVLVQGDTDTVLAGAKAASRLEGISIGHVEAGLRSYDNAMPEERNRVKTDRLSHILFAPTPLAKKNLLKEKLGKRRIVVTGNTIVDALFQNLKLAPKKNRYGSYALVTMHRPESVDDKKRLAQVIAALTTLAREKSLRVVFPAHPRTKKRLEEFGLRLDPKIFTVPGPMGFLEFVRCEKDAKIILTDSGGVQEEACILKVPCVTLRTTTERPETVKVGANAVAGYDPSRIVRLAKKMMGKKRDWKNPFGDGRASHRILAETLRGLK
jgi:UDP-N-acetylglucosamine 2-epimerase (non-hydrolysing)